MLIIVTVSVKIFWVFYDISYVGRYLLVLYALLLIWDVLMIASGVQRMRETYFWSSIFGLVIALAMFAVGALLPKGPAMRMPPVLVGTAFVFLILLGFILDFRDRRRMTEWDHFVRMLREFVRPYYGNFCTYKDCWRNNHI